MEIYDTEDLARELKVTKMTVLTWINNGRIIADCERKKEKYTKRYFIEKNVRRIQQEIEDYGRPGKKRKKELISS